MERRAVGQGHAGRQAGKTARLSQAERQAGKTPRISQAERQAGWRTIR